MNKDEKQNNEKERLFNINQTNSGQIIAGDQLNLSTDSAILEKFNQPTYLPVELPKHLKDALEQMVIVCNKTKKLDKRTKEETVELLELALEQAKKRGAPSKAVTEALLIQLQELHQQRSFMAELAKVGILATLVSGLKDFIDLIMKNGN